jgi:hypothetical protein
MYEFMTAIFRILLVLPLAFIVACTAAGASLVLALAGGPDGWRAFADQAAFDNDGLFVVFGGLAGLVVAAFVAVPAFVFILLAELFRWRSIFLYLAAGALIGLSGSVLPVEDLFPEFQADMKMLAVAGAVGGFVYWLIAGRSAGFTRPEPPTDEAVHSEAPGS